MGGQETKGGKSRFERLDAQGNVLPPDAKGCVCVRDNFPDPDDPTAEPQLWATTASLCVPARELRPELGRFTKISEAGLILPRDAVSWAVVHDGLFDLFWDRNSIRVSSWAEAQKKAAAVQLAGLDGWRAPSRIELCSLVDDTRHSPAIDVEFFPECESRWFWTSTPAAYSPSDYAWCVYFDYGYANWVVQGVHGFVRAVRAGQLSDIGPVSAESAGAL